MNRYSTSDLKGCGEVRGNREEVEKGSWLHVAVIAKVLLMAGETLERLDDGCD
jgi:hypothetical protein